MDAGGAIGPSGALGLKVIRGDGRIERPLHLVPPPPPAELLGELTLADIVRLGMPQEHLSAEVNAWRWANRRNLWRGLWRVFAARRLGLPHFYGSLYLQVLRGDGSIEDLGLASMRVVTNAGAGFIVDAFQNLVELENEKFHGFGTGSTAEAAGDTALVTELTTQYNPDNTRPTGSTTEASAQVYQTVATFTPDSGGVINLREHGIFSQAATGGGVLLDRSVFASVNVDSAAGDSVQSTYNFTVNSGS